MEIRLCEIESLIHAATPPPLLSLSQRSTLNELNTAGIVNISSLCNQVSVINIKSGEHVENNSKHTACTLFTILRALKNTADKVQLLFTLLLAGAS